ncbi:MAG: translation initiation factor IF-2 [Gammaproteobacteria bacterium]|nr:translation initiation factor IF-2 [Gammaproteobacteria bacterium]MBK81228.1 translation initiation factor IF-2 [Gammaproteobacteria bacterium]
MSDVTVKQLAESVGAPVDRLLKQMNEAGLPHSSEGEPVTEDQKQTLLSFLKRSHGSSDTAAPKKITLKRRSVGTLKSGQGRSGRNVTVEVRRKRTFVKRAEPEAEEAPAAAEAEAAAAAEAEAEALESAPETAAPAAAEAPEAETPAPEVEETAAESEAETAAEAEPEAAEPEPSAEPEQAAEPAEAKPAPVRQRRMSQAQIEMQRIREQEEARMAAAEQKRREAAEADQRRAEAREKAERERQEAERKAAEAAKAKAEPENLVEATVAAQAQAQASEKAGKHRRGKERDRGKDDFAGRGRRRELSLKSERRGKRRQHQGPLKVDQQGGEFRPTDFIAREVEVPDVLTVGELASRMSVKAGEVIKTLMNMGVMATINQTVDQDTAVIVVEEMGHRPKVIHEDAIEKQLEASLEVEGEEHPRPPVVTVMGHVDHGKTSLLDYIRKTRVTSGEAGGITQHIGAYGVDTPNGRITFIDTPGHAAFTAMRARGAQSTDIVILVVAADDGVMPQTEEAIQHAQAAGVPIVVAINKIDLEGADPERVINELAAKNVVPEEWGGDTQFVKVSAHTGEGIDQLLEAVLLQSEILELKAVPEAPGRGVVIESRLDRGRGPVATVLVQNGTLKQGDIIIAGEYFGRVRAMLNETGDQEKEAGPSVPVEVLGLNGTPDAGDEFSVASDERTARELAEFRRDKSHEHRLALQQAAKMENMFAGLGEGEKRVLKVVLKADVRGSLEALTQALGDLGNDEVSVNVLGSGVGGITETDANMALTYGAVIFGFNVRADNSAKTIIEREGIELRYYSIIYELLDDVKQVLSGMLSPEVREEIVGVAEVRDVFRSPRFGQVAGCMVTEGTVYRNKPIRVLRDNVVIFEGALESLRRFKDDVNEVRAGTECGIGVRNYNDIRPGDQIEVFDTKEVAREL